jgi:PilZ domain
MTRVAEGTAVFERTAVGGMLLEPISTGEKSASYSSKSSIVVVPAGLGKEEHRSRADKWGTATLGRSFSRLEQNSRLATERRSTRRYPLDLAVQYELQAGSRQTVTGHGRLKNISSDGLQFQADRALAAGAKVTVKVAWPVRLNGIVPLNLHIKAQAVRTDGTVTSARILKAEFRTACQVYGTTLQAAG